MLPGYSFISIPIVAGAYSLRNRRLTPTVYWHAKRIPLKILDLCRNPEPPDSSLLKGSGEGYRRADIGEYRIIYRVADDSLEILLIGKRNDDEVYRRFSRR